MTGAQVGLFALQFLGSVALARLLSPYEMGVYAVAVAITGLLSTVQAFGLNALIVREQALHRDVVATAFTVNAAIGFLLAALIAGLSTFGAAFLGEGGVRRVMLVMALIPIVGVFEFLPATHLEREAQFRSIALVNTGRAAIATLLTVGLAFRKFSFMSMAYGQLGGAVFGVLAFAVLGRRHFSVRIALSEWRRVVRFGAEMLAISGVNVAAVRASEFALGRLAGLGALGLFTRASGLNNLLWESIHLVIGRVVFVDLAAQKRAGLSLRESYLRIVEMITALLWPAFTGLAIVSGPFIYNVYGAKWVGAAHPLLMLSIASMVLVSITMTWELFVVSEETGRQARIEFVRAGGSFVMFLAGAMVSLTAAAAARIGDALLAVLLYRPHLNRMTQTSFRDFLPIYMRSAAVTLAATLPAGAVMAAYQGSERTPLAYLLVGVAVGGVAWSIALKLLGHPLASEAARLVARRRRMTELAT